MSTRSADVGPRAANLWWFWAPVVLGLLLYGFYWFITRSDLTPPTPDEVVSPWLKRGDAAGGAFRLMQPCEPIDSYRPQFICTIARDGVERRGDLRRPRHEEYTLSYMKADGRWTYSIVRPADLLLLRQQQAFKDHHQFGRLVLYVVISVVVGRLFIVHLPRINWANPALRSRETTNLPTPIRTGNLAADMSGEAAVHALNSVTPSGAIGIVGFGLGVAGFFLGGMVLPRQFVHLTHMGPLERGLLLVAAIFWAIGCMRLTASFLGLVGLALLATLFFWFCSWALSYTSYKDVPERMLETLAAPFAVDPDLRSKDPAVRAYGEEQVAAYGRLLSFGR